MCPTGPAATINGTGPKRGLYQRAILAGNADKLDIVAEVRVFFARKHGKEKDSTDIAPSDRSLREHVQAWRKAGNYDL